MASKFVAVVVALSQLWSIHLAEAIIPSGAIDVHYEDQNCEQVDDDGKCLITLLASQANFGTWPAMSAENNEPMTPTMSPDDDPLLCLGTSAPVTSDSKFVILVPRGECTFEQKALAAQNLGASGIIIYGTLASRYSLNTTRASNDAGYSYTADDIIYPSEFYDYDCSNAISNIPMSDLSFNQLPYDSQRNDQLLSGSASQGNLCAAENANFEDSCPSQKCLLTGKISGNYNEDKDQSNTMEACCAWDNHIWLFKGDNSTITIDIPAFYMTMSEVDTLSALMKGSKVSVTLYRRYFPQYNTSSVLIWMLGVFVAAVAAYSSAGEYRYAKSLIKNQSQASESSQSSPTSDSGALASRSTGQRYERIGGAGGMNQEESLELEGSHAIGFIVFSTCGLLFLFFFKVYNFVKVLYAFGCSGALFQVIVYPLYYKISRKFGFEDRVAFVTEFLELGAVTYIQFFAAVTSYGLGTIWILISFTQRHPDNILFFWVMQDIMGACMCIMFLSTMKLNSIKVAAILLTAAFFYDIFFVFVTPYLTKGGKSIMVDVATSGGAPKADPSWCEKYPDDKDCQGGDPLPMLLTIPRIGDYAGGSSLLGLGDIVLPGLLLSFAARYDEAKRFIGSASREGRPVTTTSENCTGKTKGYLPPLVVAYAVGLAMANIAVYAMQMGQPALLYLVPCCLGTMVVLGWKRGELNELWHTPKVIAACDKMIFGVEEEIDEETTSEIETHNDGVAHLRPID